MAKVSLNRLILCQKCHPQLVSRVSPNRQRLCRCHPRSVSSGVRFRRTNHAAVTINLCALKMVKLSDTQSTRTDTQLTRTDAQSTRTDTLRPSIDSLGFKPDAQKDSNDTHVQQSDFAVKHQPETFTSKQQSIAMMTGTPECVTSDLSSDIHSDTVAVSSVTVKGGDVGGWVNGGEGVGHRGGGKTTGAEAKTSEMEDEGREERTRSGPSFVLFS